MRNSIDQMFLCFVGTCLGLVFKSFLWSNKLLIAPQHSVISCLLVCLHLETQMSDIKSMFAGGAAWPELQWVVTDSLLVPESDSTESFSVPDPADIAFLQYTSGT